MFQPQATAAAALRAARTCHRKQASESANNPCRPAHGAELSSRWACGSKYLLLLKQIPML